MTPPSFDCHGRRLSAIEKKICSDNILGSVDAQLAKSYSESLAKAPSPDQRGLIESQRAWLHERDLCKSWSCILLSYNQRLYDLTYPPIAVTAEVPRKEDMPAMLVGKWEASIGPNGEPFNITKTSIDEGDEGNCSGHYKILGVRPVLHPPYEPEYLVIMSDFTSPSPHCAGRNMYSEITIQQRDVRKAKIDGAWFIDCESMADLKNGRNSCSSYGAGRR